MMKKTIDVDLSKVVGNNNTFFTGVEDQVNLNLDPFISGYAFIYWVDLPSWFEKDEDLKYFKQLTQKNFHAFSGVMDMDLGTTSYQTGFAGHEINVPTTISRQNTDFTITHKEYSGSPMIRMYQKWINMIRDSRTNLPLYPKLYDLDYGQRNHTGQLLYIVTRPDATNTSKNIVEYACLYTNVFPTNIPLGTLYNFDNGSQDSPTIEITFKGTPEIGPSVNEYAKKILREKIMNKEGDSFMPFVDSYNTNMEASQNVDWGQTPLSDIYNESSDEE